MTVGHGRLTNQQIYPYAVFRLFSQALAQHYKQRYSCCSFNFSAVSRSVKTWQHLDKGSSELLTLSFYVGYGLKQAGLTIVSYKKGQFQAYCQLTCYTFKLVADTWEFKTLQFQVTRTLF